jgi:hypothetical protein
MFFISEEEQQRLDLFLDRVEYVLNMNLLKSIPFQLELNGFADWTIDEFDAFKKGLITESGLQRRVFHDRSKDEDSFRRSLKRLYRNHYYLRRIQRSMIKRRHDLESDEKRGLIDWLTDVFGSNSNTDENKNPTATQPTSFDWRSKNVVSSVKNQLKCGSCYAFATTEVLESVYAIQTKKSIVEFSPQQLVDCSKANSGCNGGNFVNSIRYYAGQGSKIATLASYPYTGVNKTCKTSGITQISLGNVQYKSITLGDEKGMADALVKYGPIFIGLDVDSQLFMFYKSGVLSINNCPTLLKDMDHAMVAVGYGYDAALKMSYWIIRNSWGETWGEKGYVRLAKDKGNMCGITTMASYATL